MTHTAPRDQSAQEKVQTRKTVDDLKTLKIIANGFYPSRYVFEWKHGMVRVGWRLREGSVSGPCVCRDIRLVDWTICQYELSQLQYLVRTADYSMQDTLRKLDM